MWIYILIFAVVAYLTYNDYQGRPLTKQGLAIVMTCLALFVGLGDMLGGYDRYIYAELFDDVADMVRAGDYNFENTTIVQLYGTEKGYVYFNVLISFITRNRYIFIFIMTLIIYFNIYQAIKNYTDNYSFAIIIFLGFWFFFTFTYLRQAMAATIAWYGIKYILDRKLWKFLAVMAVAYMFHNSVIVFVPFYFIPLIKFNRNTLIWILVFIFILGASGFPSLLFEAYASVTAEQARLTESMEDAGARWAYLIESAVIMYFIFANYDKLFEDERQTLMTNMAIVFAALLVLFYRSENGGRLSWVFIIGLISTLSTIASQKKAMRNMLLILSFGLYIRIVMAWGVLLSPYKTFLTPGIRNNDYIEEYYEYDHNYDLDKFYR